MRSTSVFIAMLCLSGQLIAQSQPWRFTSNKHPDIQLQHIESWFSFIPMQAYLVDEKPVSVQAFYMMRWEAPNMLYRLYLNDLLMNGKADEYHLAYPDTNNWYSGMEPFKHYYFQHPAYNEYPVLGVSKTQIQLFCHWLNEKVKTITLKKWKGKTITFRLPFEVEWMVAASGGNANAIYAWEGPYMRKGSGTNKGDYMANFCHIDDSQIHRDENGKPVVTKPLGNFAGGLNDNDVFLTCSVYNYWPNGYGLFCMTGNVREFVQEDGFTKGGSWFDTGADCSIKSRNSYKKEGFPCEGFRLVAVVETLTF